MVWLVFVNAAYDVAPGGIVIKARERLGYFLVIDIHVALQDRVRVLLLQPGHFEVIDSLVLDHDSGLFRLGVHLEDLFNAVSISKGQTVAMGLVIRSGNGNIGVRNYHELRWPSRRLRNKAVRQISFANLHYRRISQKRINFVLHGEVFHCLVRAVPFDHVVLVAERGIIVKAWRQEDRPLAQFVKLLLVGQHQDVASDSLSRWVARALSAGAIAGIPVRNGKREFHSKEGWLQILAGLHLQVQGESLADLVVEGLDKQPLE